MTNIRNFSVIAHIDHGKSTLADRFIEICKKLDRTEIKNQTLDSMDLEREKGITIKSQCLTLNYELNNKTYILNLIDTPGHSDFSHEVSRALEACDGVILLIDVTQGIEAQTISNYNKAVSKNLNVIIALNKIDLNISNIDKIKNDITSTIKIKYDKILEISAKTGHGVDKLIKTIIEDIPSPKGSNNKQLEALIIDSWFNNYQGITCLINIKNGTLNKNDKIMMLSTNKIYKINELGIFTPEKKHTESLNVGEIGFITMGCKVSNEIKVGDVITLQSDPTCNKIQEQINIKPKVFACIYPAIPEEFEKLKQALSKLSLNDSSLNYTIQKSNIFGFGFKCGFLGLLHLEITQERLEREYLLQIIITPPNVMFKIIQHDNTKHYINAPSEMPELSKIREIQEPIALVTILTPPKYIGNILTLCNDSRGVQKDLIYKLECIILTYYIPMNELIYSFFNELQTLSNGFASLDYVFHEYKKSDLIKLNILINEKKVDALEFIIHKSESYSKGLALIKKMKDIIPKQLFEVKIQAAIERKIIAKTVVKALRKNVLAKCYGGDISRKKKLLKKQKQGKKRLKKIGNVDIPQNAFLSIMNINKK